ncbi:MAG: Co2+/Mg2+ efflux protein ApaG [Balneolales bacterium]|nr:Co2+/Mg2+ efflux protein ApaG [Balneolales bacterium]
MYSIQTYTEITHDIRIVVQPVYMESESDIINSKYVFVYFISIENIGDEPVQLLSRHWEINDSAGECFSISGEGVIGRQPEINPGKAHKYNSYCVLKSMKGSMEGHYVMKKNNGESINVKIPKFSLISHLLN